MANKRIVVANTDLDLSFQRMSWFFVLLLKIQKANRLNFCAFVEFFVDGANVPGIYLLFSYAPLLKRN